MTICFNIKNSDIAYTNKKDYRYEIESLTRLFFPCAKIDVVYDDSCTDSEVIRIGIERGEKTTCLHVCVCLDKGDDLQSKKMLDNDISDYETECERLLCIMLYKLLSEKVGRAPQWGILTGIRPVKLLNSYKSMGKTDKQVRELLKTNYLVSNKKLDMAFKIADIQENVIKDRDPKDYSLYISIPFCPSRCSYCSFVSHSIEKQKKYIGDYVNCLCKELEHTAKIAKEQDLKLKTVYMGGGTPTSLEAEQIARILKCVKDNFDFTHLQEFTVEAGRADTITREKLQVIKDAGVERISINPQSFNDSVLKAVGRKHSVQDVVDCYNMAREIGFKSINMDLIAGLPTDTVDSFKNSVNSAISLCPENITVHTLSIKRSSDLYPHDTRQASIYQNPVREMVDYSSDTLIKNEYAPYYLYRQKNTAENLENIGYSKENKICLYNIYIMEEIHTIIAVGAAGVTKLVNPYKKQINRIANYKFPHEYINDFNEMINRKNSIGEFYEKLV
ncbi:MAG: coproporphyrinogen dehydrogenase HemZ [Oscillospiraceae bacterium]|nr:coproporphyrinogen dehydrogenase HemZ [Oscillospiraceae bacterium]